MLLAAGANPAVTNRKKLLNYTIGGENVERLLDNALAGKKFNKLPAHNHDGCPDGKVRSWSGRCVDRNGPTGRAVLAARAKK